MCDDAFTKSEVENLAESPFGKIAGYYGLIGMGTNSDLISLNVS